MYPSLLDIFSCMHLKSCLYFSSLTVRRCFGGGSTENKPIKIPQNSPWKFSPCALKKEARKSKQSFQVKSLTKYGQFRRSPLIENLPQLLLRIQARNAISFAKSESEQHICEDYCSTSQPYVVLSVKMQVMVISETLVINDPIVCIFHLHIQMNDCDFDLDIQISDFP